MTSFLTQFSPIQIWHYEWALLGNGQKPEALTSDAASSSKNKEDELIEGQLKGVHKIMQQKEGNSSKVKELEKPSSQIISNGPKANSKPLTAFQKLPDSIFMHCIFPNLKLGEVRDICQVSKTVKRQATRSIRFENKLSWREIKYILKAGGDLKTLANVKAIGGQGDYEVTDDDIELISHLPNLEKIDLRGCRKLTDRAYIALGKHASKLTSCDASIRATGEGIKALVIGCKNLSRLNLGSCFLDDEGCKAIGTFASKLTHCDLSNTQITNAGVEAIAIGCKNLSEMNLSYCDKIDEGVLLILGANTPKLTSLQASSTKIVSREGVEAIAIGCKKLSQINFKKCSIGDDDLATLGTHAHNLTNIDVSFTNISNDGVLAIAMGCKMLSEISLSYCNNVNDEALEALGAYSLELTYCNVGGKFMQVTNAGIEALAKGCQKLSQINLSYCPEINDGAFIALGANAPELTSCIANNTKVTNIGMSALVIGCKKMSEINLYYCWAIKNDELLKIFQDHAPALTSCFLYPGITQEEADRFNANRKHRVIFRQY